MDVDNHSCVVYHENKHNNVHIDKMVYNDDMHRNDVAHAFDNPRIYVHLYIMVNVGILFHDCRSYLDKYYQMDNKMDVQILVHVLYYQYPMLLF